MLTSAQIDTLVAIAEQCPDDGGHGVEYAQALLPDTLIFTRWPIDEHCIEGRSNKNSSKIDLLESTDLYPNPSVGQFSILSKEVIESINIFDTGGKLVFSLNDLFSTKYNLNLIKYLRSKGYTVIEISKADLLKSNWLHHPIKRGHCLLINNRMDAKENSMYVLHDNELWHHYETDDYFNNLFFINKPTQDVMIVHHKKWNGYNAPLWKF